MGGFFPELDEPIVVSAASNGDIVKITDISNDFIKKIAVRNYDVEEVSTFIPNMWSRVVLFKMLTDNSLPENLKTHLSGELKGLLAIITLREIYGWDVKMKVYGFNQHEVDKIAKTLYPGTENIQMHVIEFHDEPIGGCINSKYYTGFFTSAEYNLPTVPWFDNGLLRDPIETGKTGYLDIKNVKDALYCWKKQANVSERYLDNWEEESSLICKVTDTSSLLLKDHPLVNATRATKLPIDPQKIFLAMPKGNKVIIYEAEDCNIIPVSGNTYKKLYSYADGGKDLVCQLIEKTVSIQAKKLSFNMTYDEIAKIDELPKVCLWPDFVADDWDEYYLWCNKLKDIAIEPITETDDGKEPTKTETEHSITWKFSKPPIGLLIKKGEKEMKEIGVVEIKNLEPLNEVDNLKKYEVGFDFGTTHTTIALKTDKNEIKTLGVKDRICWLTTPKNKIKDISIIKDVYAPVIDFIERDFMPSGETGETYIDATMPTVFKRKAMGDISSATNEVLDGVAIVAKKQFPPYRIVPDRCKETEVIRLMIEPFLERLKWKGHPDRHYIGLYIPHLLKLLKAELRSNGISMNNCKINWAYPIAMGNERQETLRNFFGSGDFILESEAVSYFFDATLHSDTPCISIDIGGGTTDITVWRKGTLLIESSIKLAGNVCNEYLKNNPDVLSENISRFDSKLEKYKEPAKALMKAMPESTLSMILSRYSKNFIDHIAKHGIVNEANLLNLRKLMKFAYTSLIYYSGLMLSAVGLENIDKVNIYFAGNGWSHLDWLFGNGNRDRFDSSIDSLFREAFTSLDIGAGKLEFKRSPEPKLEVAKGLLYQPVGSEKTKITINPNAKESILGEDGFEVNGVSKSFNDRIDDTTVIDDKFPSRFVQYEKFLQLFKIHGLPKSTDIMDIVQHNIRENSNKIEEPPFFTIIKAAIQKHWGVKIRWD